MKALENVHWFDFVLELIQLIVAPLMGLLALLLKQLAGRIDKANTELTQVRERLAHIEGQLAIIVEKEI